MLTPNFSLQASQAKLAFVKHLQNFRGTLQCEQNRKLKGQAAQGINPCHVASYKVCGPQKLEAQVIVGNALLERLSEQSFNALVDYVHYTLVSSHPVFNPHVGQNSLAPISNASHAVKDSAQVAAKTETETVVKSGDLGKTGAEILTKGETEVKTEAKAQAEAGIESKTEAETKAGAQGEAEAYAAKVRDITLNVGMSGGADSTLVLVLACALRDKYGYKVQAIHCIHGLDPDDDIWLQHNQQLSLQLGVTLLTPVLHIQYGDGVSPEDISRKERYRALLELTRKDHDCLLLGHQADDQVENFLLALKRGSGPQGLAGMRLLTRDERGILVRPLLDLHKLEIEQILTDLGYSYVYDLSNGYLKFERNYMRLKVLPVLRQRFAGMDKSILRSQRLCGFEHELAMRFVAEQLPWHLKAVSYPPFQVLELSDLQDVALNIALIRAYLNLYCPNIDFNLVEHCYELLLSPHDANGYLKVGDSPYVAATFLNFLCLYVPFSTSELAAFKGQYHLKLGQTLTLGSMSYTLEAQDETKALSSTQLNQPQQLTEFNQPSKLNQPTGANQLAQRDGGLSQPYGVNLENQAASDKVLGAGVVLPNLFSRSGGNTHRVADGGWFVLTAQEAKDGVCLDFDYPQSRKLKPVTRAHSREVKKLFIEYQIAPWLRPAIPLVSTVSSPELGKVEPAVQAVEGDKTGKTCNAGKSENSGQLKASTSDKVGELLALGDIFSIRPGLEGQVYRLTCKRTL